MNMAKNIQPPYPRLGEIYRALAAALDTKSNNRNVDRLAREGEFDWSLLPSLGESLIVAPLAKYIDPELAHLFDQSVKHFHTSYIGIVSAVQLDSLNREEALPLLVEHYFSLIALGLIFGIKKGFGGPDLIRLFDPELHPVAVVLEWLDQGEEKPLAKIAFPKTTGTDRSGYEMVMKWARGANLPDRQSIHRFAEAIAKTGVIHKEKILNLRRWLVVARALAHLEKESPIPFRTFMRRHLVLGMPDFDIGRVLSMAVIKPGKKYSILTNPALMLYDNLNRTTQKEPGDQAKTKADLEEFERLSAEHEPEGRTRFHIEWLYGRWHALSGRLDDSLAYYERAAELANYRAGNQQKRIVEESLVLAAHLRKKSILNRLKHRAVAFGLFTDPRGDDVIEDWEIDHLSQQFHQIFPAQGLFPEAAAISSEQCQLPFLIFNEEEMSQIKPDLRKPDRIFSIRFRDGQVRRWPQLRFFASFSKFDEVEELLKRGASVDQLDDSGGSALLCAIQQASYSEDRRVLDLLLMHEHVKETLNSITTRKQFTPLFCAVDFGEPDVVEKLLAMGSSPDLRGNIVDQTPLYYALEKLSTIQNPAKLYRYLHQSFSSDPDLVMREVLRRYNVSLAGVFGDGRGIRSMPNNPEHREIFENLVSSMVEEQIGRHSLSKLIRIIELFLKYKANPNAPHRYPEPGRTPLMLAAENNSGQAFNLMLRHGGNPYQEDASGMDCAKIAMGFGSREVIQYLRTKGIV